MHHFSVDLVGIRADVPKNVIFAMICEKHVKRQEAQKVLETLRALYHQDYTLDTVIVKLIEEGE